MPMKLVFKLRRLRDTKNKVLYVEDADNPYRGKNIYLNQEELPSPPLSRIRVTVEEDL